MRGFDDDQGEIGVPPLLTAGALTAAMIWAVVAMSRYAYLLACLDMLLIAWLFWRAFFHTPQGALRKQNILRAQFAMLLEDKTRNAARIGGVDWVVENGQFFHIEHYAGDRGSIPKPGTSRRERLAEEMDRHASREGSMYVVVGVLVLFAVSYAYMFVTGKNDPKLLSGIPLGFGIPALFGLWFLSRQIFYRYGWQGWKAAMVLDPDPVQAQSAAVEDQKVHGNAGFNSEQDAVAAAAGGRRSPLHEREF